MPRLALVTVTMFCHTKNVHSLVIQQRKYIGDQLFNHELAAPAHRELAFGQEAPLCLQPWQKAGSCCRHEVQDPNHACKVCAKHLISKTSAGGAQVSKTTAAVYVCSTKKSVPETAGLADLLPLL